MSRSGDCKTANDHQLVWWTWPAPDPSPPRVVVKRSMAGSAARARHCLGF